MLPSWPQRGNDPGWFKGWREEVAGALSGQIGWGLGDRDSGLRVTGGRRGSISQRSEDNPAPTLGLSFLLCRSDTVGTMPFATSQEAYGNPKDAQTAPAPGRTSINDPVTTTTERRAPGS